MDIINKSLIQPRVAILLPDLHGGGAERVAVNLANEFVQRGYLVDMVLLTADGEFMSDLQPGIRIIDLHVKRFRRVLFPLVQYLRKSRPDAFLANMWPLTVLALWARILARSSTRLVVAEHTTWSRDEIARSFFGGWKVRTTMHGVFPKADGIVAVSRGAAEDLAHFANLDLDKITVIYNPVVGALIQPNSAPLVSDGWWSGAHRRVIAVGNLSPIKDYATLLSAFAQLCQTMNARILILGEGICRSALEAQARNLGIDDRVFMPGFVKDPSFYYERADLHVLSSTCEGFGNVIVEALAAGTPVVSTDCLSGPREILCDGRFGRLVPVGDAVALFNAMADSLSDTHDYSMLKLRAQDFSIRNAADRYEELMFPDCNFVNAID